MLGLEKRDGNPMGGEQVLPKGKTGESDSRQQGAGVGVGMAGGTNICRELGVPGSGSLQPCHWQTSPSSSSAAAFSLQRLLGIFKGNGNFSQGGKAQLFQATLHLLKYSQLGSALLLLGGSSQRTDGCGAALNA